MLPIVVTPLHDPEGFIFPHLQAIEPVLKQVFARAVFSITAGTAQNQTARLDRLRADPFYALFPALEQPVGKQFASLYRQAVSINPPGQVLHLCFLDRLAFILQSAHRDIFIQDVRSLRVQDTPFLFMRSEKAWKSHPGNYREIEQFSSRVGQLLFGRTLDFAWCHLAVQASALGNALERAGSPDLSVLAEILLGLMDSLHTKEVDWLEWEDPFLLGRDPAGLMTERESSGAETEKRLAYVLPTLDTLVRFRQSQAKPG